MIPDYFKQFPIPKERLPDRLRSLIEPIGGDPQLHVDVSTRYEHDLHGPDYEYLHMISAVVPEDKLHELKVFDEAGDGVVAYSVPNVGDKGGIANHAPDISGFDYLVASWGDGSFYGYNLADRVWMTLGLSPRCLGGEKQQIIYDDLSLPEFGVVHGDISTQYYFSSKKDIRWSMANEYLRKYLWMKGAYCARLFFYEAQLADAPYLRDLMEGKGHVRLEPRDSWYDLALLEHEGGIRMQLWGAALVAGPELCSEITADGLMWPGEIEPMTHQKANALVGGDVVYLDDRFLERYEQSGFFDCVPVDVFGRWHSSPSYLGQWAFTECRRVGRNMIAVPIRELYKPKPDREICHAHKYALSVEQVERVNHHEEHIVQKVEKLLKQLLLLGHNFELLGSAVELPKEASEIVGFCNEELRRNGWYAYPELTKLSQVAPLGMTEQAFLSRCKGIHELWQRIPNKYLKGLIGKSGHSRKDFNQLGSMKLLQALSNIVERLNAEGDDVYAFASGVQPDDLTKQNPAFSPLFLTCDLRIADAHEAGEVLEALEALEFDVASLNNGYGNALDHVFDCVTGVFKHLNDELAKLLSD